MKAIIHGTYMICDEKRKEVADQILKCGWIEATPENIKAYMDGFEMAKRKSFEETGISAEEYIKILMENKNNPISIAVTPRQIVETTIGTSMTEEEVKRAGEFLDSLGKDEIKQEKTQSH